MANDVRLSVARPLKIKFTRFSKVVSIVSVLVGSLVLVGWALDIAALKSIIPGAVTMKANTALAFLLCGVSLWFSANDPADDRFRRAGLVCAGLAALMGLLTLCQYLFGWNLGIDQLLFREAVGAAGTSNAGRMAPTTAFSFLAMGAALLLLGTRYHGSVAVRQYLALTVAVVSLLTFVGYIYGVASLLGPAAYTRMAVHTAVTFLLLSSGVLAARPDEGLMATLTSEGIGGLTARRLSWAIFGIPLVLGYLFLVGESRGSYDSAFALSLLVISTVVVLSVVIWRNARSLELVDDRRREAETKTAELNQDLERRVGERTAQLEVANQELVNEIAERKQIEDALRMSEARYRHLVEKVQDIVYAGEVGEYLVDGPLTFVSPQAEAIMGYTPEEFLQDSSIWFAGIHPEDIARVGEETAQAFADGRPRRRLYRVRHKLSGAYRWLEDDFVPHVAEGGQVVGYYGLARDVTERVQADEARRQAEERYRALVESLPNAIVVHQQGRIIYVNPAGVRLSGAQSAEELRGREILAFVHPDYQETAVRRIVEIVRSGGAAPLLEEKFLRLDGSEVEVEVMSIPFTDQGEPAVITIFRDISERKRAEEALQESEEQLRQGQRMEAVGRLAGGIAHDFNNLLTAIIGHAELLGLSPCSSDECRKGLGEIRTAADRATTLTRQLLAFSRRQALQPHVFNLNDVAVCMAGLLKRLIGEDVHLVFQEDSALWPVEADPGQMEQVIMNLAINARDAMPEGGKLTLETANVELGPDYAATHIEAEPGPHVMLAVSDTGSGMDPELLSHIFEPFFTTKETGRGTGLGLSTVYGIVKQSGGNIWVYSEPGQGSTFKIYLPRAEKPIDWSPTDRPGLQDTARCGDATILLVEDEPAVRSLSTRVLEGHGYQVLGAASPQKAITLFDGRPTRIDLILTDVILPGMSGRAMVEELLRRPGAAPKILYMSGYTENAIVHEGRLEKGVAFLEKPFTPDGLLRKVREVLDAPGEGRAEMPR